MARRNRDRVIREGGSAYRRFAESRKDRQAPPVIESDYVPPRCVRGAPLHIDGNTMRDKRRRRNAEISAMSRTEREAMVARATKRRTRASGAPFKAKYPGWCANCKKEFGRGAPVTYSVKGKIVHSGGCPKKYR